MDPFFRELTKKYKIERNLGNVFIGFDSERRMDVVVKPVQIRSNFNGIPSGLLREISLLKDLDHDNVVRLLDVIVTPENVGMVFEYLNCDLDKAMKRHLQPRSPQMLKIFLYQMLKGLSYTHSQRAMHRDLCPWNILIDEMTHLIKICDFGLAKAFDDRPKHSIEVFKYAYRAPEVLLETNYSSSADIWSLGVIFVEMVNKSRLFDEVTAEAILTQMIRMFGVPSENEWPGISVRCRKMCGKVEPDDPRPVLHEIARGLTPVGIDLLSQMLCMLPSGRITAHDALKHPYFFDVDLSLIGCRNRAN